MTGERRSYTVSKDRIARDLKGIAEEFVNTGRVDLRRWSPEAASGLGMTLSRLAESDHKRAVKFAEQTLEWPKTPQS